MLYNSFDTCSLFLGNLNVNLPRKELKERIIFLIRGIGAAITEHDVEVKKSDNGACRIAFIWLGSEVEEKSVFDTLSQGNVTIQALVEEGRKLKVEYYKTQSKFKSPPPEIKKKRSRTKSKTQDHQLENSEETMPGNHFSFPQSTSVDAIWTGTVGWPRQSLQVAKEFFEKGQNLGNESRSMEFKLGGIAHNQKGFKDLVGRYLCAFLNSFGGSLLLGVDDQGYVQGIHCNHVFEDKLRLSIDEVVSKFLPEVFPTMYSVEFIPVLCSPQNDDCKVMRIKVEPGGQQKLYQSHRGEVYVRRDGGTHGPLKAQAIKEWCQQNFYREMSRKESELKQKDDALRAKEMELIQRIQSEKELKAEVEKLRTENLNRKNSQICIIL